MRPNLRSSNLIVALSGCIGRDADVVGAGVETTGVSGAQYQIMVEAKDKNFSSWYAANETTIKEKTALFLAAFE